MTSLSASLCGVGCVAFLPEEFAGPEERFWMLEFPADDAAPLIKEERRSRWDLIQPEYDSYMMVSDVDGLRGAHRACCRLHA